MREVVAPNPAPSAAQEEGDPEGEGGQGVAEVVDQVGQ